MNLFSIFKSCECSLNIVSFFFVSSRNEIDSLCGMANIGNAMLNTSSPSNAVKAKPKANPFGNDEYLQLLIRFNQINPVLLSVD